MSPKKGLVQRKYIFQPSIFRVHVSFRGVRIYVACRRRRLFFNITLRKIPEKCRAIRKVFFKESLNKMLPSWDSKLEGPLPSSTQHLKIFQWNQRKENLQDIQKRWLVMQQVLQRHANCQSYPISAPATHQSYKISLSNFHGKISKQSFGLFGLVLKHGQKMFMNSNWSVMFCHH